MSVLFDYTEKYSLTAGDYQATPSDVVFWRDIFSPGHAGANTYLRAEVAGALFGLETGGTWSWKLQYCVMGGSTWVDILASSGTAGVTTLGEAITDTQTGYVDIAAATGFDAGGGDVLIDSERLSYSGIITTSEPPQMNISGRGYLGTTAAAHASGATVTLYDPTTSLDEKKLAFVETAINAPIMLRLIGTSAADMKLGAVTDAISLRMVGTVS